MTIRFLVDECVQDAVADALADHDLLFVADGWQSVPDSEVAALATTEGRIPLTQDYDFGELAVRHGVEVPGIVLIYCEALPALDRPQRALQALGDLIEPLEDHLTIIEAKRVRRRRLR